MAQFPKERRKRNVMTQTELRAYHRDRSALRLTEETLAGLREYAAGGDDDDLAQDIAVLEETAREQEAALTARSAEVLATLEAVDDICRRTELRLHFYRSMEWKEVAAILGASYQTVRNRCSRALRAIVPE